MCIRMRTTALSDVLPLRGHSRCMGLLTAGLLAAVVTMPALAQGRPGEPPRGPGERARGGQQAWGQGPMAGGFRGADLANAAPDVFRRDLLMISRELRLDSGQAQIAELLLLDYEAAFAQVLEIRAERLAAVREEQLGGEARREQMQATREQMREAMRTLRESRGEGDEDRAAVDPNQIREQIEMLRARIVEMRPSEQAMESLRDAIDESQQVWRDDRARLLSEFLVDLRVILNEEQDANWDSFERALRRERMVAQGTLAGESVDLFIVMREAGISGDALLDFERTMNMYAMELDEALQERRRVLDDASLQLRVAIRERDTDQAVRLLEREARARVRIRDLNDRYAEIVESEILVARSPDQAELFRTVQRLRAYPQVYNLTRAQRAFDQAQRLEELDGRIVADLAVLRERYEIELASLNQEVMSILRREEPQQAQRRIERALAMEDGVQRRQMRRGSADDPVRAALGRRGDLDRRYLDELRALIGDDLFAALSIGPDRADVVARLEELLGNQLPPDALEWLEGDMGQRVMVRLQNLFGNGGPEITPELADRIRGMIESMGGGRMPGPTADSQGEPRGDRGGDRRGNRGGERGAGEPDSGEPQRGRPRGNRGGNV